MHPTLTIAPERVVKKVSRACNTCRLKRKKCDGLDPCAFCIDNKLECLYSKEPRRRGPPSGYLRYTETRVTILEILLGLYVSRLPKQEDTSEPFDPFLEIAKTLHSESKTCTQDVWDTHKAVWTRCNSARLVEELVVSFAPFTPRSAQEAPVKTLLPPPTTSPTATSTSQDQSSTPTSGPVQSTSGQQANLQKSEEGRQSSLSQTPFTQTLRQESFERTGNHEQLTGTTTSPVPARAQLIKPGRSPAVLSSEESQDGWLESGATRAHQHAESFMGTESVQLTYSQHRSQGFERRVVVPLHNASVIGLGDTRDVDMALGLNDSSEYTGSYWRTVELSAPEPHTYAPLPMTHSHFVPPPTTFQIDLPPSHILSRLLDVYYQYSHSSYPLLPSRATLDTILCSPSVKSEVTSALVLSVCAYSGRLSHSTQSAPRNGSLAGKIAADLWYEQARTALSTLLKKESSLELVQASLLLALRDYGKGNESQAWILSGLAVRMAQDLRLHEESTTNDSLQRSSEDVQLRRNVWGVCTMLDLLLSLQSGKPPTNSDVLKIPIDPASRSRPADIDDSPLPPFSYAVSLCRVIAMINFHLYLGYPSPSAQTPPDKLSHLRTELDMWHHSLPMQYRIAIGHQPRRDVLEINMLYHVAIILLYRPISREQLNQQTTDVFLEAASTFNVLLEKYRQSQANALSNPTGNFPALSHTNPNMIYLIYTTAIAHLSGYKLRQVQQGNGNGAVSVSPTSALQTQLHLLKCLEALASIGFTWELARRCWKALDTYMEIENLKPRSGENSDDNNNSLLLGKRKRDLEDGQKRPWLLAGGRGDAGLGGGGAGTRDLSRKQPSSHPFPADLPTPVSGSMVTLSSSSVSNQFPSNYPPVTTQSTSGNLGTSEWDATSSVPYTQTGGDVSGIFDPSIFSTKWMPEASQSHNTEWDNSWDENSWPENYMGEAGLF